MGCISRFIARHGNQHRGHRVRAKIDHQVLERLSVESDVAAVSGGVDALAFGRRQERGDSAVCATIGGAES